MANALKLPQIGPQFEEEPRRSVSVADLLLWHSRLRTLAAALYDLGHPCLANECWDLAAKIEATANPIFEEE
jgi:hypothetical protein